MNKWIKLLGIGVAAAAAVFFFRRATDPALGPATPVVGGGEGLTAWQREWQLGWQAGWQAGWQPGWIAGRDRIQNLERVPEPPRQQTAGWKAGWVVGYPVGWEAGKRTQGGAPRKGLVNPLVCQSRYPGGVSRWRI